MSGLSQQISHHAQQPTPRLEYFLLLGVQSIEGCAGNAQILDHAKKTKITIISMLDEDEEAVQRFGFYLVEGVVRVVHGGSHVAVHHHRHQDVSAGFD